MSNKITQSFDYQDAKEKNIIWDWQREEIEKHLGVNKIVQGLTTYGLFAANFELIRSLIGFEGKAICFENGYDKDGSARFQKYSTQIPLELKDRVTYYNKNITDCIIDKECDYLVYDSCGCLGDGEIEDLVQCLLNWRTERNTNGLKDYPAILTITCSQRLRRCSKRDIYNSLYPDFLNRGIASLMKNIFGRETTVLRRGYKNEGSLYEMYSFIVKIGKS